MLNKLLVSVLAVSLTATAIYAQERMEKRQEAQKQRIEQGVKNGSLTKHEGRKLAREQRRIEKMEQKANADGEVTAKEKIRLEHAQDKASRDIYKEKHDQQMKGDNRPDAREAIQKERIKEGVKSGQLTREEAQGLKKEQREIKRTEKAAEKDGQVTPEERQKLEALQDAASKNISQEKHDADVRQNVTKPVEKPAGSSAGTDNTVK